MKRGENWWRHGGSTVLAVELWLDKSCALHSNEREREREFVRPKVDPILKAKSIGITFERFYLFIFSFFPKSTNLFSPLFSNFLLPFGFVDVSWIKPFHFWLLNVFRRNSGVVHAIFLKI